MKKYEFEKLLGQDVDIKTYQKIDLVYTYCPDFPSKQAIVDYFNTHDMDVIEKLYLSACEIKYWIKVQDKLHRENQRLKDKLKAARAVLSIGE